MEGHSIAALLLAFLLGACVTALGITGANAIAHGWLAREVRRDRATGDFVEKREEDLRKAA